MKWSAAHCRGLISSKTLVNISGGLIVNNALKSSGDTPSTTEEFGLRWAHRALFFVKSRYSQRLQMSIGTCLDTANVVTVLQRTRSLTPEPPPPNLGRGWRLNWLYIAQAVVGPRTFEAAVLVFTVQTKLALFYFRFLCLVSSKRTTTVLLWSLSLNTDLTQHNACARARWRHIWRPAC